MLKSRSVSDLVFFQILEYTHTHTYIIIFWEWDSTSNTKLTFIIHSLFAKAKYNLHFQYASILTVIFHYLIQEWNFLLGKPYWCSKRFRFQRISNIRFLDQECSICIFVPVLTCSCACKQNCLLLFFLHSLHFFSLPPHQPYWNDFYKEDLFYLF